MSKALYLHLESISEKDLEKFREEAFIMYASSNGVKLGVDCDGYYVVKNKTFKVKFKEPSLAILEYKFQTKSI